MSGLLEFEGPKAAYCFGRSYDTLTSVGVKRQGQPYPGIGEESEENAWAAFERELAAYQHGAGQIAWRERPYSLQIGGAWYISCRLAAFP
jgi:hypothetical protein